MSGGKGGSQTSSTKFSKYAKQYITPAANAVQAAYQGNQANLSNLTGILNQNLPSVISSTINNPTLGAANSYDQDVLAGKYLTGNPYLDQQIAATNGDVTSAVNAGIGTRGLAGGSAQAQLLARELAKNETNLRYTDYNNERQNMNTAAGSAAQLSAANSTGLGALLNYVQTTGSLPTSDARAYADAIGGLVGSSKSTTTQQNPGVLQTIGSVAQIASLFSDRRLKRAIEKVGEMADGLGIYTWQYVWGGDRQTGVMADEVADKRPWALGPRIAGFATVNYGAL